jgi:putative addiction module killer protein
MREATLLTKLTHTVSSEEGAQEYLRADGSAPFSDSFLELGDEKAKAKVDTIVRRLARGLRPDVRSLGEGVHESRIDYGPGYRVYFGNDGPKMVVLLLSGDKTTQQEDIVTVKELWTEYKARKNPPATKQKKLPVTKQDKLPLLKLLRPFSRDRKANKDDTHS